ncbi:MAG: two-component sensor histidine kinase [Myxococcales bacterium]|nr:two-component sensor histidine kinase [Myxococcales bacterium]|tara:strand:+ start:274 stop:1548 length:1275 start_codon:yes stop_codon:yes gene_type:complete
MEVKQVPLHSAMVARLGDEAIRHQDRFVTRAQTLAYTRLILLAVGMSLLAVPSWARALDLGAPLILGWYLFITVYAAINLVFMRHRQWGRIITAVTLALDLLSICVLIHEAGGIASPLMSLLLIFSTLVALVFPHPLVALAPMIGMAGILVAQIQRGTEPDLMIFYLVWYGALNLVAVALVIHVGSRDREQTTEILGLERHLKNLAVVQERSRIAREMHDGIGAALSSMIIQAEFLTSLAKDPEVKAEADELHESAQTAIDELRRSLKLMKDEFHLVSAMGEFCETHSHRTRVPIDFQLVSQPPEISGDQQLAFFRVLQECVSNAIKHANPSRVEVSLDYFNGVLKLEVEDDGVGFDPTAKKVGHYGLVNMRERATRWGGRFTIESAPGSGCKVEFSIPVREPEMTLPGEIFELSRIRHARVEE